MRNQGKKSKPFTATPRPVGHFRLRSEVVAESHDTFESVSKALGSILEVVGAICVELFNFRGCNFLDI